MGLVVRVGQSPCAVTVRNVLTVYWSMLTDRGFIPVRKHDSDAGWDLVVSEDTNLPAMSVTNVPTGIAISIPKGWFGHLTGRSSTAKKYKLLVVETVIDAGYRGELFFQIENPSPFPYRVARGRRLAQILFLPVPAVRWVQVSELPPSSRDRDGLGSTGE